VSATATSVNVKLFFTDDDNGSRIALYELWIDQGNDLSSNFRKVTTYDGIALTHTLTAANDNISPPGAIFRMKYRAKNVDGQFSEFSKELIFALGSVPSAPNAPQKNDELSG